MTILDSTEAQLRFGSALSSITNESGAGATPSTSTSTSVRSGTRAAASERNYVTGRTAASSSDPGQNRKDFLHYALSLMRAHNGEHSDSLPVLDVSALKHIAYVFDALIYYMRSGTEEISGAGRRAEDPASSLYTPMEEDNDDTEEIPLGAAGTDNIPSVDTDSMDEDTNQSSSQGGPASRGRKHGFFQRSESTLCLGCPPPDPFNTPMSETLPLADQPHLLTPGASREDLFGAPSQELEQSNPMTLLPTKLGLSARNTSGQGPAPSLNTGSAPYQST